MHPLCADCGTFAEAKGISAETLMKSSDNVKGKKRVGEKFRAEREEHAASRSKMSGRSFQLYQVYRDTISATYVEDDTVTFLPASSFKDISDGVSSEDAGLGQVKRDLPGMRGACGILVADGMMPASSQPGVVGPVSVSATSKDGKRIVKYMGSRVVLRECLLDGPKVY